MPIRIRHCPQPSSPFGGSPTRSRSFAGRIRGSYFLGLLTILQFDSTFFNSAAPTLVIWVKPKTGVLSFRRSNPSLTTHIRRRILKSRTPHHGNLSRPNYCVAVFTQPAHQRSGTWTGSASLNTTDTCAIAGCLRRLSLARLAAGDDES